MKIICLILLLLSAFICNSQVTDKKFAATFTIATISVPENIGIQPGVEYKINDRVSFALQTTFRIKVKPTDINDLYFNQKYLRIIPELKYWFNKKQNFSEYISLRTSFSKRNFFRADSYYYDKTITDSAIFYDQARINSPITTLSIQIGKLFPVSKKFSADFFFGSGIRILNTEYLEVLNPRYGIESRPADGPIFKPYYIFNGRINLLHITAGIKLFYRFN